MKLVDKLPFFAWRRAKARMLSLLLIAALLWSAAGIVPTAKAGPIGPNFTWKAHSDKVFVDVAYGDDVYVAITQEQMSPPGVGAVTKSRIWVSGDMSDWEEVSIESISTRPLHKVNYSNGRFILTPERHRLIAGDCLNAP